jgi:hypothetical protein
VKTPRLSGLLSVRPKQGQDLSDWSDAEHPVEEFKARRWPAPLSRRLSACPSARRSCRRGAMPAPMLAVTHDIRDALGRGD